MASKSKQQELQHCLEILYSALRAKHGVEVMSDDPQRARMRLYEARRQANDPALSVLQFRLAPWDHRVIAITKTQPQDQENES